MNTKQYPIIDGHRKHYVRYPVLVTADMAKTDTCSIPLIPGRWVAVDVMKKGYSHLISPINFESEELCQRACNTHNRYHGWSDMEVKKIITESMKQKKAKHADRV